MRRSPDSPDQRAASRLATALLGWFAKHARDLPWRRTLDPYAIWVSEVMLQQTQVKTVIPYWERWMHELPTARALANAPPEKVLKLWEGLGYYTRARNLQKAAQLITREHDGKFPVAFGHILALPGVGRYTAGAIASIAFNQPAPILDGNVIRVLTRLFGIAENPREKATNARLWGLAEALVQTAALRPRSDLETRNPKLILSGACSALNQALMELGALVCTPQQPQCNQCPVRRSCVARAGNQVGALPNLGSRAATTVRRFAAFVVQRNGQWLVRQRPADVVNAHLWEFPNVEMDETADLVQTAATILDAGSISLQPLVTVKHTITRYRITLEAFMTDARLKNRPSGQTRWLTFPELERLAFTSAHRKVLQTLGQQPRTRVANKHKGSVGA